MNGGTLVVDGNAGSRLGFRMRRGLAIVKGDTGPQAGTQMQAGTIGVFGHSSPPIGAEMRRGTILLANGSPDQLAPTFRFACRARPVAFVLLQKHIRQFGVAIRADEQPSLYNGDFLTGGRGEVWMADST